jgi:hypothetical protein
VATHCRRRRGIVVLDEPDDRLDRAVLDAYLQLRQQKRRILGWQCRPQTAMGGPARLRPNT